MDLVLNTFWAGIAVGALSTALGSCGGWFARGRVEQRVRERVAGRLSVGAVDPGRDEPSDVSDGAKTTVYNVAHLLRRTKTES